MNKSLRKSQSLRCCSIVEVKSKYGAEFRRFSLDRSDPGKYKDFHRLILRLHHLWHVDVLIGYADVHGELLPINNDNNFCKAVTSTQSLLRIFIQLEEITVTLKDESFMPLSSVFYLNDGRKEDLYLVEHNCFQLPKDEAEQSNVGVDCMMKRKKSPVAFRSDVGHRKSQYRISMPHNFRPVSSIIDVDIVPECHRRVRLHHQGSDRPLGFYIRDGTTVKVTPYGLKKVQGIFISRIVPGGLAESTGLLAINDQVLEVNGIDVSGKSLDQVTDMMIANSRNLIITVKPANQHNNIRRKSCVSSSSRHFLDSMDSVSYPGLPMLMKAYGLTGNGSENEEDRDMIAEGHIKNTSWHSSASTTSYTSHPHVCTSHKPQYFARQPNSLISAASYHSQPCLNYTAHAEQELPLHRHQTPQKHYGSKPSIRQGTSSCSTHDILSTWHIDVSQHLMLHQGEMVEDGIVVIL